METNHHGQGVLGVLLSLDLESGYGGSLRQARRPGARRRGRTLSGARSAGRASGGGRKAARGGGRVRECRGGEGLPRRRGVSGRPEGVQRRGGGVFPNHRGLEIGRTTPPPPPSFRETTPLIPCL